MPSAASDPKKRRQPLRPEAVCRPVYNGPTSAIPAVREPPVDIAEALPTDRKGSQPHPFGRPRQQKRSIREWQ